MVTIKEIAEELGVSTTTVSNVIHGKTRKMSAETRKKIEEALVRYHYVADYRTEKETEEGAQDQPRELTGEDYERLFDPGRDEYRISFRFLN